VRTVLHNELGLDITNEQEDLLLSRVPHWKDSNGENSTSTAGMRYGDFAKYFQEVSRAVLPSSEAGSAAAMGFHRDKRVGNERANSEMLIHIQPQTILRQKRHQLQQLLMAHSSHAGSGMRGTNLFLTIDDHRSGKVTMQEFLDWINSVGMQWTAEELKQVVLGGKNDEELENRWFGSTSDNGKVESGMTEHDFSAFVESLDRE